MGTLLARRLRLAAGAAILVVATLTALWFIGWGRFASGRGGNDQAGANAVATPVPVPASASPAAIVYLNPGDPSQLLRIGYDGLPRAGSWALTPNGGASHIVGVSPGGQYLVTVDPRKSLFEIVNAAGQIASTVAYTMAASVFGVWSGTGGEVCQLAIGDPGLWQLSITTVPASAEGLAVVPIASLRYPPYISVVACDPASNRALLVEPLVDSAPTPRSAPRAALVLDLSTGRVVQRISIGDSSHGTVFSLDGRYLASIDYVAGTSSIVSVPSGRTVRVERGEVRGFSADDSRVVVNSGFELQNARAAGTTSVVEWRSGRVLYSQGGWTNTVRSRPASADLALNVLPAIPNDEPGGPANLVIVPAGSIPILLPNVTIY